MKRKPTPAQIAARERFAEMARSGAFKRKAKRNPAKKTVSQKISQLTREGYPQKQAVAIALSEERKGKVKRNPIKKYIVYTELKPGNWKQVRVTENLDIAKELAKSNAESGYPSVVEDSVGAILYTPQVKANPIILVSDKPIKTRRKSNPQAPSARSRGSIANPNYRYAVQAGKFYTPGQKTMSFVNVAGFPTKAQAQDYIDALLKTYPKGLTLRIMESKVE